MNTSPKIFLLVVVFASFAVTAYGKFKGHGVNMITKECSV